MQKLSGDSLFKVFSKVIAFTALMIVLLWLLFKVSGILLVFILAMVIALIVNAPVSWLEKRNIKRAWASTIVFSVMVLVIGLISWLIIPKIAKQFQTLINLSLIHISEPTR